MFIKIWKTIRIFLITGIVLICMPHSILPIQKSDSQVNDIENYLKLNKNETRLIEFKDNEEALKLKLMQLDVINKSRKKFRADPVRLDILASRVANKMCKEAAENDFIGHWNLAGEKPYHRYAFAGGYDHVSENAFGEWSSGNYDTSKENIRSMMRSGHEKFMAERAPNDGHKKTIIDKPHNFIGIGYFLSGKQFRYYEEFIDRYLDFEDIPSEMKVGEQNSITVKTDGKSFLYCMIIYRENYPQHLTPSQIRKKGSYGDFTDEEYRNQFAWDLSRYRNGITYRIPVTFTKEGLYYIQIYTDKKEITKPTSLNTKGKTPVSGIVIRVTR
ncbi:MAG: CAP domain-containing protein [Bacteroidetes bacterium]|nr:MAG: CAP domain-containing protein [Bacteroidota bacterium]